MDAAHRETTHFVLELGQISPADIGRVGAKAAHQASLLRAGFPVPAGVVLTTDAHLAYTNRSATVSSGESPSAPLDMRALLDEAVAPLGEALLAVRSSGVAEDLPEVSFAGLYESVLDVRGIDEVEVAVRRCWASVLADRVVAYRDTHGLETTGMAVLIQRMVPADAAGVAFSANPLTGQRGEVVINAVRGLGDRLVSGEVSPDEWLANEREAVCERAPENAIDAEMAWAIAELTRRVEAHFGCPQDVEWAIADDHLYLLQARPITVLPDPPITPIPIELDAPPGFWMYDASHNPRPGHHMDLCIFPLIRRTSRRWASEFGYLFDGLEWTEVGMWPYQRMVPLGGRDGPMPPSWVMWLLVRTVPMLRRRVRQAAEAIRSDKPGRFIEDWYRVWHPELQTTIFEHLAVDLTVVSDAELSRHIDSRRGLLERGIQIHMFLHGALAPILHELATTCEELLGWDLAKTMDLVSGTSYKSTEPALRLHDLAVLAARRPAIRRLLTPPGRATVEALVAVDDEFAHAFRAYRDRYGHRALGYTFAEPTLAEMPSLLLDVIRRQLERDYDPATEGQANDARRAKAAATARSRLVDRPRERARFDRALQRAERAYPVREDNEFFTMSAPLAVMRYSILEMGRRLAERGLIDRPGDVMHLELEEARSALSEGGDLRPRVARRRGERAWAELHPGPPFYGEPPPPPPSLHFLPPDARLPMESILWSNDSIMAVGESSRGDRTEDATLRGIPASRGSYTGSVRVAMDETQFDKLEPGDVLVCPITSPVWSVLFPTIGALVTDTGGVLSHPAIIAREYRIPAVVATGSATTRLHDGDLVTVDGSGGVVTMA